MRLVTLVMLGFLFIAEPEMIVRKAIYRPVEGSDIEHGQGAIERHDLPHREVEPNVWFIRVPAAGSCEEWAQRLSEAAGAGNGSFTVQELTREEQERVDRGEITFQR